MLAASGNLWLVSTTDGIDRSIQYEVTGGSGGPYLFSAAYGDANPSVGSVPVFFSDFYGHTQGTGQGRVYCSNLSGSTAYISIGGSIYTSPTSDSTTLKYEAPTGATSTVFYAIGPAGQPFAGEIDCNLYRRTKQTSGAWGSPVTSWTPYSSQTYSCDFGTYDYYWSIF